MLSTMLTNITQKALIAIFCSILSTIAFAQPTNLPLFQIQDLQFEGGFNIPSGNFGVSNSNYSVGIIEYNPVNHSLFLVSHDHENAIGEFSIPALVNSTDHTQLNTATNIQGYVQVLDSPTNGNPQAIDRISGMKLIDNKLIVNGVEWYDAPANNTNTTIVIDNAANLQNSTVQGYYSLQGAAHAAGWITPVPSDWQPLIGSEYITGSSSKYSINGRLAIGVSAFGFDHTVFQQPPSGIIPTTTFLDYSLANPLYEDYSSYQRPDRNLTQVLGSTHSGHTFADAMATVGTNDLWTDESQASFGMIIPGTRTYFSIGHSGGHNSGIGYKATQNNGNLCGGPCPYDADDYYNYYWLWDVNDLLAVKNGTMNAYDVRPYDYGVFNAPYQYDTYTQSPEFHEIRGGTFDPATGMIYLTIYDGGSFGTYSRLPAIAAYKVAPTQYTNLDISVLMEAPYNENSGAMSDQLETLGLIPTNQPFNQPPWNYEGGETKSIFAIADWVLVSFRTGTDPNTEIAKAAGLLQIDGRVYFTSSEVLPANVTTPVYVVIESRNHLTVMSSQPVNISNGSLTYDFTQVDSYSTTGNTGQKQLSNGKWVMYAGDLNHDHDITGADKAIWSAVNGTFNTYLDADINFDGDVNGSDRIEWERNNGVFSDVPK